MGDIVQMLGTQGVSEDVGHVTLHRQLDTTDAVPTLMWSFTLSPAIEHAWMVTARVIGRRTGGAAGTAADTAAYVRVACIKSDGSTISVVGSVGEVFTVEDNANWGCTIDIDSGVWRLLVNGDTNNNVSWVAQIEVLALV